MLLARSRGWLAAFQMLCLIRQLTTSRLAGSVEHVGSGILSLLEDSLLTSGSLVGLVGFVFDSPGRKYVSGSTKIASIALSKTADGGWAFEP
jgi:hypothetical protein